jgi:uncharacterized UBP type Zn finger protein
MDIHPRTKNKCDLFPDLAQASAVRFARQITELSPNFVPNHQEDPSEFLVVLFDHLMTCLSSVALSSYSTYLSNPLHFIFGLNMNSEIECTKCRYKNVGYPRLGFDYFLNRFA